jgi:hypothetical protein
MQNLFAEKPFFIYYCTAWIGFGICIDFFPSRTCQKRQRFGKKSSRYLKTGITVNRLAYTKFECLMNTGILYKSKLVNVNALYSTSTTKS